MKRSILVAVISSLLLGACAFFDADKDRGGGIRPFVQISPNNPRVTVSNGYVVVDQEPIAIVQRDRNTIVWALDPNGPYYFPTDERRHPGIDFLPPKLTNDCKRDPSDSRKYLCNYNRANKAKYAYQITVTKNDQDFLQSDPTVMND